MSGDTLNATNAFEKQIRPILATQCVKCHGAVKQEGNLRLDSRDAMLVGGDSGPAIVPGRPEASLLMEAIRREALEMPPDRALAAVEIRAFERWIAEDAVWPDQGEPLRSESQTFSDEDRSWWAWQPLIEPTVPAITSVAWANNQVDAFVYRRLAARGIQPAPRASKATLVRRLYFDLLGLPPSPREIDAYLNDPSVDAWPRLIDRLLDDPRYGEHWARYWLDLVRYAESDGWKQDAYRPSMWRYRDYVVDSFNQDRPYPEFIREQLAGDEVPGDIPDHLAATGFLRLGIYEYNQRDARSHWNDIMNEITDVTGDVFLGMGVACARCHDHKFDPILQEDYYKLRAFFEPLRWRDDVPDATYAEQMDYRQRLAIWEAATADLRAQIDALVGPYRERKWKITVEKFPLEIQACFHKPEEQRTSWENQMAYLVSRQFLEEGASPLSDLSKEDKRRYEELMGQLASFDSIKPAPLPKLMAVSDFAGEISPTKIPGVSGSESIEPGVLAVFSASGHHSPLFRRDLPESSGRRTALAEWLGNPDNPLPLRVFVNRIWQHHFGRGIVATANDFGRHGQPPTHPDLLDWLAVQFRESGWSTKRLHRLILMSATWQQSAYHPDADTCTQRDAANELIWHAPVRRLSAEQLRDAMLSVSGELDPRLGGPSVNTDVPRRGLYLKRFRNNPNDLLHAFDAANGLKSVAERNLTITPTQSLLLINGEYCLGRARMFAGRLRASSPDSLDQLKLAFRLTWGREPTAQELASAEAFLRGSEAGDADDAHQRLVDLCHVLLNSNEFVYRD